MRRVLILPVIALALAGCNDVAMRGGDQAAITGPGVQQNAVPDAPAFYEGTGNYYEAVAEPAVTWDDAAAAAAGMKYRSCTSHLATITSIEENDFITTTFPEAAPGGYWLGGAQTPAFGEPAGGWGWVTGEPFFFTNWNPFSSEPNDAHPCLGCNENRIHFAGPFTPLDYATFWNDEWQGNFTGAISGYVVEYDCGPDGRVVERVTGSGHITYAGELRTFSFNARKYADGAVEGEYQFYNRAADAKWHGNVTCFEMQGDQVWLGGTAELGNFTPPNDQAGWTVVDNGEGAGAAPDQISLQWVRQRPGFASAYCTAMPQPGEPYGQTLNDVEAGNIQIR